MYYYKSQKDETAVIKALQDLAFKHPTYGFRNLFAYIRDWVMNGTIKRSIRCINS
jgi:putative transposase